jgi:two-component system response regulator DctR
MTLLPCVSSDAAAVPRAAMVHLVDDDVAVRDALGLLLRTVGYRVHEHASAESLLGALDPDEHACIVLDIRLVGLSGIGLAERLALRGGATPPIVFISGHADVPLTVKAFKLGAVDLLQKPVHEHSLIEAVERALAVGAQRRSSARDAAEVRERLAALSPRERLVLEGIAAGHTNRELAERWGLSVRTVESHRAALFEKLGVRHVIELAPYASAMATTREAS